MTAYVLLLNLCKGQSTLTGPLAAAELRATHSLLLQCIQHRSYQQELRSLLKRCLQCPTLVQQLSLF